MGLQINFCILLHANLRGMFQSARRITCLCSLSIVQLNLRQKCIRKSVSYVPNRGKKDDTNLSALFIPVPVKPNPDDINVGAELTGSLNKSDLQKILNKFYQNPEIKILAVEHGLDSKFFVIVTLNILDCSLVATTDGDIIYNFRLPSSSGFYKFSSILLRSRSFAC